MKVKVELLETSQPVFDDQAQNTYTKGDLFVVYVDSDTVYKFPTNNVFRITESYK